MSLVWRPRKSGGTRDRTGCLTCRQRKKKCDLQCPICRQCTRLNLVCQREQPRQVTSKRGSSMSGDANFVSTAQTLMLPSRPWIGVAPAHDNPGQQERQIMRYYIQVFTTLLTTNLANNSFLSVLLPLALQSPVVNDALLAWASSHLALRNPAYETVAMRNRVKALSNFRAEIAQGTLEPEAVLATSLVFCSMESIEANSEWLIHLRGASSVIETEVRKQRQRSGQVENLELIRLPDCFSYSTDGAWLLRNFAYHDLMMAVSQDRAPLYTTKDFFLSAHEDLIDTYYGVTSQILANILDICDLNVELQSTTLLTEDDLFQDTIDKGARAQKAQMIASSIRSWIAPSCVDQAVLTHAQTYRAAALLYLYRIMRRHGLIQASSVTQKVEQGVSEILDLVDTMPTDCLPACTLLFPLFIAGGEATNASHMARIGLKMKSLVECRGFKNVEVGLSILQDLWTQRKIEGNPQNSTVDWIDIVKSREIILSLS